MHKNIYHSEIGPSLLKIYQKRCLEKSENDEDVQSESEMAMNMRFWKRKFKNISQIKVATFVMKSSQWTV